MKLNAPAKSKVMALAVLLLAAATCSVSFGEDVKGVNANDRSDLTADGIVDYVDLQILSLKYLEMSVEDVDWCVFYESVATEDTVYGRSTKYFRKHFKLLLGFIFDAFECEEQTNYLLLENEPNSLVRIALDDENTGNYYISDAKLGSVFIYDANRVLIGELKNLDTPLGIAIDSWGRLLVGNDGKNNIEVYDTSNGDLLFQFGQGLIQMPNSIKIGPGGRIYVTDSKASRVWVFEASYLHSRTIGYPGFGQGELNFPVDTTIVTRLEGETEVQELFVADQANHRIQVYDLHGNFVRSLFPLMTSMSRFCGCPYSFCRPCPLPEGSFTRLKALNCDAAGRLHSLDMFEATVTILDPVTGESLGSYGGFGDGPGLVRAPQDVLITGWGNAFMTDSNSGEIEDFVVP